MRRDGTLLSTRGGGTYQTLAGAASLFPLLSDRGFVCLHYRLAGGGPAGALPRAGEPAGRLRRRQPRAAGAVRGSGR